MNCQHQEVTCLNEYELIWKYRCGRCGEVMMCACDKEFGCRFLPHQLDSGTELVTQQRVPVTIGFQPSICRECRGLPIEPHPVTAGYGRTSKIKRYYWRELFRRETELLAEWAESNGIDENPLFATGPELERARDDAARKSLHEIKQLHAKNPKYRFDKDESQADVIANCDVRVVPLKGVYVLDDNIRGAQILCGNEVVSPEEFASRHFREQGYETLFVESVPFHALFGVFMWLLVQDPEDERLRIALIGDRTAFEEGRSGREILFHKPDDFGSPGYGQRRKMAIERYFREILAPGDLDWLFDYWLEPSEKLRQYLWAHREKDIATARTLLRVLPKSTLLIILRYLVDSYWEHYLGWPDLLVFRTEEFFFAEVKSSNDGLSEEQKRWIRDNLELLKLPFELVKIHRIGRIDAGSIET